MIDLSYCDIYGNKEKTCSPENTYIISSPGDYCFPLLYGNSWESMLDYRHQKIKKQEMDEIIEVEIINWDSSREFIDKLRIFKSNVCFCINLVPERGANYIVAGKNKKGIIVWSWHLWLWKNELKDINNLLNVNLGTIIVNGKQLNWLYQWGRKEPLNPGIKPDIIEIDGTRIGNGISKPNSYLLGIDFHNSWWGTNKTIYDPCPRGYKVPDKEALKFYSGNCDEIIPSSGVVRRIDQTFPFSGFRGIGIDGEISKDLKGKRDLCGFYWTNDRNYSFGFNIVSNSCAYMTERKLTSLKNAFSIKPQKI